MSGKTIFITYRETFSTYRETCCGSCRANVSLLKMVSCTRPSPGTGHYRHERIRGTNRKVFPAAVAARALGNSNPTKHVYQEKDITGRLTSRQPPAYRYFGPYQGRSIVYRYLKKAGSHAAPRKMTRSPPRTAPCTTGYRYRIQAKIRRGGTGKTLGGFSRGKRRVSRLEASRLGAEIPQLGCLGIVARLFRDPLLFECVLAGLGVCPELAILALKSLADSHLSSSGIDSCVRVQGLGFRV
jgi:hypothetical protein